MAIVLIAVIISYNSVKKIRTFKVTAQSVAERQKHLDNLKKENEKLKDELTYKESSSFAELEIRNKLGLAKEGEAVVIVPNQEAGGEQEAIGSSKPNWLKWRLLVFGK